MLLFEVFSLLLLEFEACHIFSSTLTNLLHYESSEPNEGERAVTQLYAEL